MGISVEFSHHEGAPGQQEIDLRYADALSMADNVMTFRYVVKEVAIAEGVRASFMPKPFAEYPGSAMHTHMSLFEGETNAFHSPDDPTAALRRRQVVHRRHPRARAGDQRRHQPVGELLQAAGARRRGADRRVVGRGQPLGAGAGADVHAAQGVVAARRGAQPRFGMQPVPDVRRAAGGGPARRSRRATRSGRRPRTTCGA